MNIKLQIFLVNVFQDLTIQKSIESWVGQLRDLNASIKVLNLLIYENRPRVKLKQPYLTENK